MLILWLNALVASGASMVWMLWAHKWVQRGHPFLAALYTFAAIGTAIFSLGFVVVIVQGDPLQSAALSRWMVVVAIGVPALAKLLELIRDEARAITANKLLDNAEARADRHDRCSERSRDRDSLAVRQDG